MVQVSRAQERGDTRSRDARSAPLPGTYSSKRSARLRYGAREQGGGEI